MPVIHESKKPMDNWNDIAIFVRVVEAGSFTAAAEKLGLSQSAASKSVTRLEERLGTRLLNRSTRRLSLTETGSVLHARGLAALQEMQEAELEVARLQTEPRGVLRVSAPMSFGVLHLAPLLPEFLRLYPALTVDIQMDDRLVDLVEEGYDLAIRIQALADSTLVAKRLAPSRNVICAAPDYLARHGEPKTPQDLRDHHCLIYSYRANPFEWEFQGLNNEKINVSLAGPLHCNSGLVLREAALAGSGILLTPTFYVGDVIRNGRLRPILNGYTQPPEANVYAVYPERRHLSPKVRAFVDFLSQRFGDNPNWDRP